MRWADDFVGGFQHRAEAERILAEIKGRLGKFGLELHPERTRRIEFGRFAAHSRRVRGEAKAQTINFLGFTHSCGKTREGWFAALRTTMRTKWRAKLREVTAELRRRMHAPVPEQGTYLGAVVRGHIQYYGVPRNGRATSALRQEVIKLRRKPLQRRSHKHRLTRERMQRLVARWLPPVRICHPYPSQRFGVRT